MGRSVLKEFLIKGFVMDDARLAQAATLAKITLMNYSSAFGKSGSASGASPKIDGYFCQSNLIAPAAGQTVLLLYPK